MSKNVLILDDSASMRQMIGLTLSENGYTVTEAANGVEGLNKMENLDSLKLIITDINMPEMDGINFIKNVRSGKNHKFVPIIVLTTESENEIIQEGKKAGASAWIVKPFSPDKLNSVVSKVVGN